MTRVESSFEEGEVEPDQAGIHSTILRVTGGDSSLLHRLLTGLGRVLEINGLASVTTPAVEAARGSRHRDGVKRARRGHSPLRPVRRMWI